MYQALYRKWRPKVFADVVGQEHITETLRRQVAEGRLSHAYLFTGTRGTGKTTCAKILAKAVNCEHPVDGDPCGKCPSCLGLDDGTLLDVTEMDAASNNGVNDVRVLRDEAIYAPAAVKKRVYIIDEVHMLTTPAFNALLKILEEPPEHLIFILATTELHKVPATILSRCQRFSFKRIQPRDIAKRLETVAAAEQIDLQSDGAELLARLADGALRDALSLLDQCAATGGAVNRDRVLETLGLAGNLQTAQLMELLLRRDSKAALLLFHQLYVGGKDVTAVIGELSTLARDLLISVTAPEGGAALLSGGYDGAALQKLTALTSAARLIQICSVLQETASGMALSVNRRTDAELCLLRLCDETLSGDLAALNARITRLEERREAPAVPVPDPTPTPQAEPAPAPIPEPEVSAPAPEVPAEPAPAPEEPASEVPAAETPSAPAPQASGAEDAVFASLMEQYKNRLRADRRAFVAMSAGKLEGDTLTVYCPNDLAKSRVDDPAVVQVLREVTEQSVGRPISVRVTVGTPEGVAPRDKMDDLLLSGSKFDNFTIK